MDQPGKGDKSYAGLFAKKDILLTVIISLSYLLISKILIGYKPEQLVLVLLFNALFYLSFSTRKFISGFSVFIIFWIIFDYMKAFPNYLYNTVHIESLYNAEKNLFGIQVSGQQLTPNEFWQRNTRTWLDLLSGFFYLCWVPVPLFFAAYLFFSKRRQQFIYFALTFLFVNLLGFVGYYVYPAAPPWYVQLYGFQFQSHTPGNTAGLHRFDDFFHAGIFQALYAKSSNVFAAMPSLHSAYNMIVLYYGIKNRMGIINVFFAAVVVGIWFAAVYSGHHYVLDVLGGIVCAVIGMFVFQKWVVPNRWFQRVVVEKFVRD
jgi:membrane-associated phospholipid phosphatase